MNTPAVSVILPTYNRAHTLRRAIDSVLAQTHADLELIVVDDGSTDDTAALLASIADPRLRVERPPANEGAAAARNRGISAARGEWLAFQDSDDQWLAQKLERQMALAAADIGLVLCGYQVRDGTRSIHVMPRSTLGGGPAQVDALDGWPIITPTWLVRRELLRELGGFRTDYRVFEDWDLAFRIIERCRVAAVGEPLLIKFGSSDALCANPRTLRDGLAQLLADHASRWAAEPQRLARRYAHLGALQFVSGQRQQSRASLARAARLAPASPALPMWMAAQLGRGVGWLAQRYPRFASMQL
ncbi:MAG TPA: glycosyltransferase family 2 protein [Nevskiaceae bacterium]|nr:glycosyltransferase family 2 protein [Nevskiaceae bacterium]